MASGTQKKHAKTSHPFAAIASARLKRLRSVMRDRDADHALVTDPRDVAYFTGFLGGDSYLLVGPGKPLLLSDSRYEEEVNDLAGIVRPVMRDGPMSGLVARCITELAGRGKLITLALQAEHVTLAQLDAFKSAIKKQKGPVRALRAEAGLVSPLRAVKDDAEIALIRRAARIQQDAMLATMPRLKPGMAELEACAVLEHEMKARGSTEPAFGTIVAAQANGSKPHSSPGDRKLKAGRPVLIDWGATWRGYRSDMTRVFSFGSWPRKVAEIHEIVLEAHEAAAAALEAGARCVDVDAAAREVIDAAGYGDRFGHGLGHGIGLNIHEGPSLSRHAGETVLEAGMVVTIEPGIYLPGIGGVRIEDDYVVTANGAKNLCTLPKDRDWATL